MHLLLTSLITLLMQSSVMLGAPFWGDPILQHLKMPQRLLDNYEYFTN